MGRIENFKTRGRNRENKQRNPIIAIACEGNNKTEETYYRNFNSKKCIIRFSKGNSTDPVGIVKDLLNFINTEIGREEKDKYYAVFDTDVNQNKQAQIEEAKKLAIENGVEIITSTPAFEIWFLLHFGYSTKCFLSSEDVKEAVKKKIDNYSEKVNVYPIICAKTMDAIKNAKQLEKYQIDLGQTLENENCNPYTAAYKVVEELIKRNK